MHAAEKQVATSVDHCRGSRAEQCSRGAQSTVGQQGYLSSIDSGGAVVSIGAGEEKTASPGFREPGAGEQTGRARHNSRVDAQVGAGRAGIDIEGARSAAQREIPVDDGGIRVRHGGQIAAKDKCPAPRIRGPALHGKRADTVVVPVKVKQTGVFHRHG